MTALALIAFYVGTPLALLLGKRHVALIDKVGVVTLCYSIGLVSGNAPGIEISEDVATQVLEIVVPLSIPLLLFSSNWKVWRKAGPTMLGSFGCGIAAVSIAIVGATLVFADALPDASKLGGMMMGVYTGGTPNMSAIGITLGVDSETFVVLNAADVIFGGVWLLFILSVGRRVVARLLGRTEAASSNVDFTIDESFDLRGSGVGVLLAALLFGAGIGISFLLFGRLHEMTILMVLTTGGIAASTSKSVRDLEGTFAAGNFLLLVFCVAVGSLANVESVLNTGPTIVSYVGAIMGGAIVLHIAAARLFKFDPDTMLISSTAGIFGPAFIAPVARAIGNPQLIPVGLALSLLGFAIGNYCGLAMAHLLAAL